MQPFAEARESACPYCGESVEVAAEPWGPPVEDYTEDCPVCCRPWRVHVERDGESLSVSLLREDA